MHSLVINFTENWYASTRVDELIFNQTITWKKFKEDYTVCQVDLILKERR